jgi:predicted dienelactone hydrolase
LICERPRHLRGRSTIYQLIYDPFLPGRFTVAEWSTQAFDAARNRRFPCDIWRPTEPVGTCPIILLSHSSGGSGPRAYTFLSNHLASHGYIVAGLNHSELVAPELGRRDGETPEQRAARVEAAIASRVPDIRCLLDHVLTEAQVKPAPVGIVGHSFGGWTALAAPDVVHQIQAVVALAPGGSSNPRPGILPAKLAFKWGRDVPTLVLAADNDVCLPIDGMYEIFERIPAAKRMVVLRHADHMHFMDNVEQLHEAVRTSPPWIPELDYLQKEMRPIAELCTGEQSHLFVRGLTVAHFDAVLKHNDDARQFLACDIQAELASRGVEAFVHTAA